MMIQSPLAAARNTILVENAESFIVFVYLFNFAGLKWSNLNVTGGYQALTISFRNINLT